MHPILVEVLIIGARLLVNGVLAMSEIAVVTSRRARLAQRATEGSAGARSALSLVDEPTRFLSTVQIGITLIGVLAGAFGGATIADELDARLELIPALAPFSEALSLGLVVVVISFASLVVGELVPKRIAMQSPERIAEFIALPMQAFARLASPLVTVLTFTTRSVLRLLRVNESKGTRVTEEEIRAMISEGRQSGAVHVAEHDMLEGVFRLGDRSVDYLMVPRPDVDWVDIEDNRAELAERLRRPGADTILVCRGSLDEVVGVLRAPRALALLLDGAPLNLMSATETALFVPGSMGTIRLLELLRQSRQRVAVVLDEFGGVEGVVSLQDVLAEIVGDVPESAEEAEQQIMSRGDGTFLVDGSTDMDEVSARFGLGTLSARERGQYRTLGGFVMARLGRVPRVADRFEQAGVRFEVVDMDARRVDKVLVTPTPAAVS
jgi:putative hemolysin